MKRRLLFLIFLLEYSNAVRPIWKTPVSEPNPVSNDSEEDRQHSNAKRAQPNYYTRPEQIPIPDYRNPRQQLPRQSNFNPFSNNNPGHFRPFAWVGPQPKAGSPQTTFYNQSPNKGQFPNGLPPLPPNWQQYPVQMIWIPDTPGQPSSYSVYGNGPVPPAIQQQYGQYGPGPSTDRPMKPSVNPQTYTGTIGHSPSANPTTLPYDVSSDSSTSSSRISPTSSVNPTIRPGPQETIGTVPTSSEYRDRITTSDFSSTSPYDTDSTSETSRTSETSNGSTETSESPQQSTDSRTSESPSDATKQSPNSETTLPYDADTTREVSAITPDKLPTKTTLFQSTNNPFSGKTIPPVVLESDENDEPEDISKVTGPTKTTSKITPEEEEEEMMKNFFPRPVSPQQYQPPGHQPEDFTSHINVNFKKPKGCTTLPCRGVDTDKISLYKPDRDNEGTGPTLVISNAAKDDASRAGYKPPPAINPYIPPPPPPHPEEEYAIPYSPPPAEYPFPPFSPSQPKILMPAHNFPPPATSRPSVTFHETTVDTIRPTAQTISTRRPPTTTTIETPTTIEVVSTTEEDTPEYVPPAIIHMTASTPSGKNPPTFVPLHPELLETTTREQVERETQTPATVTRNPTKGWSSTGNPGTDTSTDRETGRTGTPGSGVTTDRTTGSTGTSTERPGTDITTDRITGNTVLITGTSTDKSTDTTGSTYVTGDKERTDSGTFGTTTETVTSSESLTTDAITPSESTSSILSTTATPKVGGGEPPESSTTLTPTISTPPTTDGKWIFSTDTESPNEEETYPTAPPTTVQVVTSFPPTSESSPGYLPNPPIPPRGNPYAPPEGVPRVPNRLIGKPRILCLEDGISFEVKTILPLNGEVFANGRKRVEECQKTFTEDAHPKMFLPFSTCGVKNVGDQVDSRAQYHMQVVMIIDQGNGTNTLQSFMAQCIHQKVNYNKQVLPKRIEEALEELRLIPSKLEQKASMPNVEMQIVVDEGHHKLGAEVAAADIGMALALRWALVPESDAYGMHVRSCKVIDAVGKIEHTLIDEQGCSADLQIIDHPHYDTYHDTASAHMWAFKVPDMSSLQIKCDILICSNIKSSISNTTSCEDIPSPPYCADVVTSPPNSILSDASSYIKTRRASKPESFALTSSSQSVRASICLSTNCRPDSTNDIRVCVNTQLATTSTGLSITFLLFAISFQIIARSNSR